MFWSRKEIIIQLRDSLLQVLATILLNSFDDGERTHDLQNNIYERVGETGHKRCVQAMGVVSVGSYFILSPRVLVAGQSAAPCRIGEADRHGLCEITQKEPQKSH